MVIQQGPTRATANGSWRWRRSAEPARWVAGNFGEVCSLDPNLRFIHPPADPDGPLAAVERRSPAAGCP